MKTNYLNFGERQLPAYLGYGILDESSVLFENDVLKANYVFESDGSLVPPGNMGKRQLLPEYFLSWSQRAKVMLSQS